MEWGKECDEGRIGGKLYLKLTLKKKLSDEDN